MSSDPDVEMPLSVSEGQVTVKKSFEADEFPVPAIKLVVESTAEETVEIRLIDTIPESFPMESVGFHPDFEKDNWTAYKSHRVEYERVLEPGEEVTTVYGIRLDDTDPTAFMTDPEIELLSDGEAGSSDQSVDDIVGEDSNQVVRDVLSGERDSLPGLDDSGVDAPDLTPETESVDAAASPETESEERTEDIALELDDDDETDEAADADTGDDEEETDEAEDITLELDDPSDEGEAGEAEEASADAPQPVTFDASGDAATTGTDEAVVSAVDGEADTVDEDIALEIDDPSDDGEETDDTEAEDAAVAADGPMVTAGSVAAALAAELQRGDVDDEDVEALREVLGVEATEEPESPGIPRTLELRIQRLQTQVEDLAAYSAGLEAFLDEEGTAEELIEGFRTDVEAVRDDVDRLAEQVDAGAEERTRLDDELGDVTAGVERLDEELDSVDEHLSRVDDRLAGVDERVDGLEGRVDTTVERLDDVDERSAETAETAGRLDEEVGEVRDDIATLDGDITEVRDTLNTELEALEDRLESDLAETRDAVESDVDSVRDDVDSLRAELETLNETVEDFRMFRNRLSDALGPLAGGGAMGGGDNGDNVDNGDGGAGESDDSDDETADAGTDEQ